ncbi:MAG: sirohydrochlorin cobaltochelatase [Clostridia bacterium]|nr:sirohydrochlorin cobaltochelatase [Clostridia bacterium]
MSIMKKLCAALCVLGVLFAFAGCQKVPEGGSEPVDIAEKDPTTAILVVSFGTSYNDSREKTIGAVEKAIAKAYPEYDVRRAFTSQIIIDKLAERDNLQIDNVTQALDRAAADGIKTLIVQPTHLMNGYEYTDLKEELDKYTGQFEAIKLGAPLLTSDADFDAVVEAITADTKDYDDGQTAIVFMGHGTEADSNEVYAKMNEKLQAAGHHNYYVGTVEAKPDIDDVAWFVKMGGYKRVVLLPLMVVAGDHANNDMAGNEEDSWKSILSAQGYEVVPVLKGLGELPAIQQVYVSHIADALK